MKFLGIDDFKVIQRWENSFKTRGLVDSDCSALEEDYEKDFQLGIHLHPGITINDMTYRGYLDGADLQDAICSSFSKKKPDVCKTIQEKAMEDIYSAVIKQA